MERAVLIGVGATCQVARVCRALGIAVLAGAAAAVPAACRWTPQAGAGALASVWDERDAAGRRLLRERGTLRLLALGAEADCETVALALRFDQSAGHRDYDGRSNLGQPLRSLSHLQQWRLGVQGWWPLAPAWVAGAEAAWLRTDRRIDSVGPVQGYPERFDVPELALGLRHQRLLPGAGRLDLEAWLGGGPAGRVHLQLPAADPAVLRLGEGRLARLAVTWASPARAAQQPGWGWQARLQQGWQRWDAGPASAIMRNGLPVGGAAQPRTEQRTTALVLEALLRLD